MIEIKNVSKTYGDVKSLENINSTIAAGSIYGLIGSNGSGKSTLLRIMSGIMRGDEGQIDYDGESVFENPDVKKSFVFLSDEQYFLPGSTLDEMAGIYASFYPNFSREKYHELAKLFNLPYDRKINTFSKGMKKQASVLLALASNVKYILCDETFDGLDPVMRQLVKKLLANEVVTNGMTAVIASHNLREIEDICDHIGLLHKGGILFESELDSLKREIHAVQIVLEDDIKGSDVFADFHVVSSTKRGSLSTIVARGERDAVEAAAKAASPQFCEIIPLTLEEIFISEMEERGYDYSEVLF
ncbi:MAG: ABC transporter ATP-binding protein [Clostridia bacterium]|nr:ABC transporter ATP-binding protein [Clostridia bacterium]